jgi:hypothetical protein
VGTWQRARKEILTVDTGSRGAAVGGVGVCRERESARGLQPPPIRPWEGASSSG